MRMPMFLVISIFILVLIGYGERCEANDINAFVKSCLTSFNWPKPLCECPAKKADERLTRNGFAYQIVFMNYDRAKMAELLSQLDMNEKLDSGMFMVNISQECGE